MQKQNAKPSLVTEGKRGASPIAHAWIALSAFIAMCILLSAFFEWLAYRYGEIMHFLFFEGVLHAIIFLASLVALIRMAVKRAFKPLLIYAFIVSISVVILTSPFHNRRLPLISMDMKARIFAAYPQLCQTPPSPTQRVSICYRYMVNEIGGEYERIVFNPGNEMSQPPQQWPDDIRLRLSNAPVPDPAEDPGFLCMFRKTKRIADGVYRVSIDC